MHKNLSTSIELIDALKIHYLYYFFEFYERFDNFFSYLDNPVSSDLISQYCSDSDNADFFNEDEYSFLLRLNENTRLSVLFDNITLARLLVSEGKVTTEELSNFFSKALSDSKLDGFLLYVLLKGQSGFPSSFSFRGCEFLIAELFSHINVQENMISGFKSL